MAESKYSKLYGTIEKTLSTSVEIDRRNHLPGNPGKSLKKAHDVMIGAVHIDIRNLDRIGGSNRDLGIRVSAGCYSALLQMMHIRTCLGTSVGKDSVHAIYAASDSEEMRKLFSLAATLSSTVNLLNLGYSRRNLDVIRVGIGVSVSRGLRFSYRSPSGCRASMWKAECIDEAEKLAHLGGTSREGSVINPVVISRVLYDFQRNGNYPEDVQVIQPFSKVDDGYHGDIRSSSLEQWIQEHRYDREDRSWTH